MSSLFLLRVPVFVAKSFEMLTIPKNIKNNTFIVNNQQLGKAYGVESVVLGPKESKELYPLLNVDDLYGTLHSPGDGTIDPASWATTLTRAAIKNGGKV